ncbi:MAG: NAD(P)-binding protein [Rhodospirillaceae bacterium]|nr:NAD(P)-binding protein [Rhodospirillaceae bacterium]
MRRGFFNRRQFLKAALYTSVSAAALSAGGARLRAQAMAGSKVIVIGSGLAGLGAAKTLAEEGAEVIVLEAKPHIGGRLFTDFALGPPFEVGAGWIHGPSAENPVTRLAEAVDAQTVVTDDDNLTVFDAKGEELDEEEVEEINEGWADALEKVDSTLELHDKRSLKQALGDLVSGANDESMVWALSAYTEFSKGAPIENLSAVYHDDDDAFDLPDVVVVTGYDKILAPIAEGLDIRLSTRVSAVQYGDGGVTVETDQGTFAGDYVVCSIPLGVLKAGTVAFNPPLPSNYRENIEDIGFGSVTKIALKFDAAFWDVETQYFGIMTAQKGRWNYWVNYRTFAPENIILGLSVGAYAPLADRMSDAEMQADALEILRDVWGDAVGEPVQMLSTHWSVDPDAFGAYAFPTPGCRPSQFDDLAEPVAGRIFLCGEHTMFDYAGTTHGAYLSGLRAAEFVIEEVS